MRPFHVSDVSAMLYEELTEHAADAAGVKAGRDRGQADPARIRMVEAMPCPLRILLIVCVRHLEHFNQVEARPFRRARVLRERPKEHGERAFQ